MIWLASLAVLVLGWYLLVHRRPRKGYVQDRSEAHEAALAAFQDWLQQPEIVKAALKAGTITRSGWDALQRALVGAQSEQRVITLMSAFLQSRDVRMAVAKHMNKSKGAERSVAMRQLMAVADMGRKVRA